MLVMKDYLTCSTAASQSEARLKTLLTNMNLNMDIFLETQATGLSPWGYERKKAICDR